MSPSLKCIYSFIFILVCLTMSGCVGVATITGRNQHNPYCIDENGEVDFEKPRSLSTTDILRNHGKPVQVVKDADGEHWRYHGDWKWRGVVVWVIAPVAPLIVPIGQDYHTINFVNGVCASEDIESSNPMDGYQCGFFPDGHGAMALQCGSSGNS